VGALNGISTFTPLTFSAAGISHTSTLGFGAYTASYLTPAAAGYASSGNTVMSGCDAGDIWLTPTGRLPTPSPIDANFGYHVAVHEIGHAMGLRHPAQTMTSPGFPVLTGDEDSQSFTIMSPYAPVGAANDRVVYEFQLYDIAALQRLYGPNTTFRALSDSYGWSDFVQAIPAGSGMQGRYFSIWDASGTDIIDAKGDVASSHLADSAYIDLRPGYFSSLGMNTDVTFVDSRITNVGVQNVSIAFGAYIENARGTVNADALVGNNFTNSLDGDAGDDLIFGSGAAIASANTHAAELGLAANTGLTDADAGDYRTVTQSGIGTEPVPDDAISTDVLTGGEGNDIIVAGAGNSTMSGGDGDDKLMGGLGADTLDGGGGTDTLWGMEGTDTVTYATSTARITISFNGAGQDTSLTVADGSGGTDTLHSIEKIVATSQTDYLYYNGEIPDGYVLEIDLGSDQGDVIANAAGASTSIQLLIDGTGTGTLKGTGPGVINLLNAGTQIIGSAYDDEITDLAVHDGLKRIDGGGGNDVITVGGSDALIRGGDGDDELSGGDGNDVILGSGDFYYASTGADVLSGGGGADHIVSTGMDDRIDGGDGSDWIEIYYSGGTQFSVRGGRGNDVIDATHVPYLSVTFGADDGHDMILRNATGSPFENYPIIVLDGIDYSDITIIWDVVPGSNGYVNGSGDAVLMVESTGATIFIPDVYGAVYFQGGVATTYTENRLNIGIDDGAFHQSYHPEITVVTGSVASYATAVDDYAAAIAAAPGANNGTAGDDSIAGSRGDDSIDGGNGDDSFQSSGGTDAIDGGAGSDSLFLFGARGDFFIARDALTGDVTLEDGRGLEGTLTLKSVEKIYFATDNLEFAPGDLVGYWGGTGNDILIGSNYDNEMFGLGGNDELRGGGGDDRLEGGVGDDWYFVDDPGDSVIEGAAEGAQDRVFASASYTLSAGAYIENLSTDFHAGTAAIDLGGNELDNLIFGNAGDNRLDGHAGADAMIGWGGNDFYFVDNGGDYIGGESASDGTLDRVFASTSYTLSAGAHIEIFSTDFHAGTAAIDLSGNELGNLIYGNAGSNVLDGKQGNDALVGFGGADTFAFTTALGANNVDFIFDFDADDVIALDDAVFTGLGLGALSASAFTTGTAAQDAADRIVYNQATGQLFYDADGNGNGAQMLFATLSGNPILTASDFTVI
jgi:Ca2+-binding RTX toxin-like protein